MTPIASKRIASATLLGGPHASAYLDRARPLGFTGEIFSEMIGQASAAKMCRSVIIKGIEALVSESMLAARCYGVEKEVLHSLSDLLPVGDWEKLARYLISRGLEHGARRAQEMREAARTVKEAGVELLMSMATGGRPGWAGRQCAWWRGPRGAGRDPGRGLAGGAPGQGSPRSQRVERCHGAGIKRFFVHRFLAHLIGGRPGVAREALEILLVAVRQQLGDADLQR